MKKSSETSWLHSSHGEVRIINNYLKGGNRCRLECPSRRKVWGSTFSFASKLILGLNNSRKNFRNFLTSVSFTPSPPKISTIFLYSYIHSYIAEIFDGTKMKNPLVGKFQFFSGVIQAKSQLWLKVGGFSSK